MRVFVSINNKIMSLVLYEATLFGSVFFLKCVIKKMKEKWYWGICSLFMILLRLISSEDKTPLGYMCERNSQCMSDCCDVSECKESSKCNKIFGLWTIIGIVVLLIIVILVTVWIVAACCGYCTCILCCLKEKFRRRREKKDSEVEQEAARSTDIPLGDTEIRFMDPEEEERYRLQLALSYPSK